MKRSEELFLRKNNRVLNVYCTAGYPQFDSTLEVMKSLQAHGADIIELGMPYSDPLADGPVIQQSSMDALDFIFLVTPETSEARVKKLDSLSTGFLYVVSSSSTTGSDKQMDPVADYLKRLKGYGLRNPLLVGFGIKDKASFDAACTYANGAVIGSAYIRAISEAGDIDLATKEFLDSVLH